MLWHLIQGMHVDKREHGVGRSIKALHLCALAAVVLGACWLQLFWRFRPRGQFMTQTASQIIGNLV